MGEKNNISKPLHAVHVLMVQSQQFCTLKWFIIQRIRQKGLIPYLPATVLYLQDNIWLFLILGQ